jgi:hypothetical protein
MPKIPGTDPGYFAVTGWEGSFSCCVPYSRSFDKVVKSPLLSLRGVKRQNNPMECQKAVRLPRSLAMTNCSFYDFLRRQQF